MSTENWSSFFELIPEMKEDFSHNTTPPFPHLLLPKPCVDTKFTILTASGVAVLASLNKCFSICLI